MKNSVKYMTAGIAVTAGGVLVSDIAGAFFNGMDYGSACVLGVCLYLCVVVVTCTGMILEKLSKTTSSDEPGGDQEDQSEG